MHFLHLSPPRCDAALKLAVHASQRRHDVLHVITELHRRLQDAGDWLVSWQYQQHSAHSATGPIPLAVSPASCIHRRP